MHTIRFRGCVVRQDNKTLEITVQGQGYPEKRYTGYEKLSGKELRAVVNRYLWESEWVKEGI